MNPNTQSLRDLAHSWSLAGDHQLLGVLQNMHESLIQKCQETNTRLEQMLSDLDDTSISLQNVNNKFMALKNTQFVESRVYDDDMEMAPSRPPDAPQQPARPAAATDRQRLERCVHVLERYHEPVHIQRDSDSDTDSGSDVDLPTMVLKPRDLYAERPLPYIIGSHAWKSKWHAGLQVEDSDTASRSSESPRSSPASSRTPSPAPPGGSPPRQASPSPPPPPRPPPAPAVVAAELARRLAGDYKLPERGPEDIRTESDRTSKTVYKPHRPLPGAVFSDEPPPLHRGDSPSTSSACSEDEDIFASLHRGGRPPPGAPRPRADPGALGDLFGELGAAGGGAGADGGARDTDVFRDFGVQPVSEVKPVVSQKQTLVPTELEPALTVDKEDDRDSTNSSVKKPAGGISLFGSNRGTESIAAAILQRNARKHSTSDEETGSGDTKPQTKENIHDEISKEVKSAEKNILEELFAKPEKQKKNIQHQKVTNETVSNKIEKKVDIFSDNLFDDIDDIFTSEITKVPVKQGKESQKSIFDDDDLFAEIPVTKTEKKENNPTTQKTTKSIFDSDDELFSENINEAPKPKAEAADSQNIVIDTTATKYTTKPTPDSKRTGGLFDSDEKLFRGNVSEYNKTDAIDTKTASKADNVTEKNNENTKPTLDTNNISFIDSDEEFFSGKKGKHKQRGAKKTVRQKSPFDDIFGESDDDVFSTIGINAPVLLSKNKPNHLIIEKNTVSETSDIMLEKKLGELDVESVKTKDDIFVRQGTIVPVDSNISIESKVIAKIDPTASSVSKKNYTNNDLKLDSEKKETNTITENKKSNLKSPLLFEDDEVDELFVKTSENIKERAEKNDSLLPTTKIVSDHENMQSSNVTEENVHFKTHIKIGEVGNESLSVNIQSSVNANNAHCPMNDSFDKSQNSNSKESLFIKQSDEVESDIKTNALSQSKTDLSNIEIDHKIEQNITPNIETNMINKIVETNVFGKETLPSKVKEPKSSVADIFEDIFPDQPPVFEKPKEPKRSKNVNALFDDDSDDEALFFKKTDPTLDEKPEDNAPGNQDGLFGIFHDEPPAIDGDLTENIRIESQYSHETMSGETSKDTLITKDIDVIPPFDSKTMIKTNEDSTQRPDNESKKPVGKLKPMCFSINVNTLLPGASHKKQKIGEQIDGQEISTNKDTEITRDNVEDIVRTVSFGGDPESEVLDNKLSKSRAKIQVKRRPSTRRARKEAARKSAIYFGEDSIDNSSSIDETPKSNVKTQANTETVIDNNDSHYVSAENEESVTQFEEITSNVTKQYQDNKINVNEVAPTKKDSKTKEITSKTVYILNDEDIFSNSKLDDNLPSVLSDVKLDKGFENTQIDSEFSYSTDETFKTAADSIIESKIPSLENNNEGVKTLGNVYKESMKSNRNQSTEVSTADLAKEKQIVDNNTNATKTQIDKSKSRKSIFDDLSDEESELFGGAVKKPTLQSKANLFDSDTDEDWFSGKRERGDKIKKEIKQVAVKKSLFDDDDDDDDDDDLFGVKVKRTETNVPKPSQDRQSASRESDAVKVFVDPLSTDKEEL